MESLQVIRVVINTPAKAGLFDYLVPESLRGRVRPGHMVIVPFNHTMQQAVVWQLNVTPEAAKPAEIIALADEEPVLTPAQLRLAEKIAERSLSSIRECVNLLLTDKIRKVSRPVYRLIRKDIGFQTSLTGPGEDVDGILALFSANDGTLDEETLDKALGKKAWRRGMDRLIRDGSAVRSLSLEQPALKPRTIPVAVLTDTQPEADAPLAKAASAHERRRAALDFLSSHGGEAPRAEMVRASNVNPADVQYLVKKGWLRIEAREVMRGHRYYMNEPAAQLPELTAEQSAAVERITAGLRGESDLRPILLHGVTGSGKTEVYLRAAAEAIRLGKQVLMLVPEIGLTPQILTRFESRFPGRVGVYHSNLSSGERYDTWRRGRNGEFRVIVGPRSALAVPLPDLGLILVDECHEDAYYQTGERPFFSAVRAAADYAEITGSQLVLGSATPTTAQMFKAQRSGWHIETLKNRATGVLPPRVMLVDMRAELRSGNSEIFSTALLREIDRTLKNSRQCILFLNRRGAASYTFCHNCGESFTCPNCDVPYTYHASRGRLECHYCGSTMPLPEVCPVCGSSEIRRFGAGVELVEQIISEKFPTAGVLRLDADSAAGAGNQEKILSSFANHEADILVGTQMVAKGLDFPDVRLVGILLADVGANFNDYRVDEHSYQMLTQVAGRAGRAREQGLAILQTYQPERYSIRSAVRGDYDTFYRSDLSYRRLMGYPPFSRLLRLELRGENETSVKAEAEDLARALRKKIRDGGLALRLIGPAPCFFPRLAGKYRWHIILRGTDPVVLIRGMELKGVRVEVDPVSLL